MPSLVDRLRQLLSPTARADRQSVASLAKQLGVSEAEAESIYRRAREVGFGAAMSEHEDRAREPKAS